MGQRPKEELFREVAGVATEGLDLDTDIHASAEYRREVAGMLAQRVLEQAAGVYDHQRA